MSTILEHFKPPPLASDPPAKTKFWPAPPTNSAGGILQRPKPASNISASSSSSLISDPSAVPPGSPSVSSSTRVSFAPLPDLATRKRRNSITLGVAARSAALRRMKERNGPPPGAGPQNMNNGGGAGPRPPIPHPHPRSNSTNLGRRSGGAQYTYQSYQAGLPRPRRPPSKGDQVVDLGEVAMDAGKKLWRAVSGKKEKGRKSSGAASDSGRPAMDGDRGVGGPTVGASGHNTEREILVRGFAVPEEVVDEEDEDEDEDEDKRNKDAAEAQAEAQHRTEDYVAGIQGLQLYDDDAEDSEAFAVDPSAVSPTAAKTAESIEPGAIHSTRLSPPPLTPESEVSDLTSTDGSLSSSLTSPNAEPRSIDGPPSAYLEPELMSQPTGTASALF